METVVVLDINLGTTFNFIVGDCGTLHVAVPACGADILRPVQSVFSAV